MYQIAKDLHLCYNTIKTIKDKYINDIQTQKKAILETVDEQYKISIGDLALDRAKQIVESIDDVDIRQANLLQKATSHGILAQRGSELRGEPGERVEITGKTDAELRAWILLKEVK